MSLMTDECQRIRRWLDGYLRNELMVETNETVLRHLDLCAGCREELARQQNMRRVFKDAFPDLSTPRALRERVLAEVFASVDSSGRLVWMRRVLRGRGRLRLGLRAAVIVGALGVVYQIVETAVGRLRRTPPATLEAVTPAPRVLPPVAPKALPPPPAAAPVGRRRAALSAVAITRLEVDLAYRLHRVDACLGEQVVVMRAPDGAIVVSGLVEDAARKREIVSSIGAIATRGPIHIDVKSMQESGAERPSATTAPLRLQDVEISHQRIPLYDRLHAHFSTPTTAGGVDEAIQRFATGALQRSALALQHAWALHHLSARPDPDRLDRAGAEVSATWRAMVRDHARALRHEVEVLRLELRPALFPEAAPGELAGPDRGMALVEEPSAASHVRRLSEETFALTEKADTWLRRGLALAPGGLPSPDLNIEDLRVALARVAELSGRIERSR
jgi:hypothetical protein